MRHTEGDQNMTALRVGSVRVRYAPSPTGYLHIGGARTALFNWLYARRHGGSFVLRIEDTDAARGKEGSVEGIARGFRWLGLDWDEGPERPGAYGPYFQSERVPLYREAVDRLLLEGKAYHCYCTPAELEARREEARLAGRPPRYDGRCHSLSDLRRGELAEEGRRPALRLRIPETGTTSYNDVIRAMVSFDNIVLDDFVLMRSDGMPTYNFACVVDDHLMAISHVIRADEHISNTPKQILIYEALGWSLPLFAHVPMILAPDRSKLSKRHGAQSVEEYRDMGFLPEAIVNYLAFLGWTPEGATEFLTLDEMVGQFALDRVTRNAAIYDLEKMRWINAHYLRTMDPELITRRAVPFYQKDGLIAADPSPALFTWLMGVVSAMRERVKTLAELPPATSYFFSAEFQYDEKAWQKYFTGEKKDKTIDLLTRARRALAQSGETAGELTIESAEAAYRQVVEEAGSTGGDLFHPTRLALSGRTVGPGLFDLIALLGRDESLARLDRALARAQA
jgi:glutamyl-tRNA synthetase